MFYKIITIFSAVLLITSCSVSPSYDVYVHNKTDDDLTVSYKSTIHKDGPIEEKITLKAQERLHLISTVEIKDNGTGRTNAADCSAVADYINIYNSQGIKSSASWCSDAVEFAVVDVGQGEFIISVEGNNFK